MTQKYRPIFVPVINLSNLRQKLNGDQQSSIELFRKVSPPEPHLVTANLLASLNKSINQIRDWLAVLEDMLKTERVDISDVDSVAFMLERQKVRSSFI